MTAFSGHDFGGSSCVRGAGCDSHSGGASGSGDNVANHVPMIPIPKHKIRRMTRHIEDLEDSSA